MYWINAVKMLIPAPTLQTDRVIKWHSLLTVLITMIALHSHTALTQSQFPADHLIPPPPPSPAPFVPIPQALSHSRPYGYSKRYESHPIPINGDILQNPSQVDDQTGLMTRIARWFGFSGSPQEQQLLASSAKHPEYSYPKPQATHSHNGKAPCNMCNKYPWIPMMPLSVQYPPSQQQYQPYQQAHWNQQQAQASKHAPAFLPIGQTQQQPGVKQRAVQFNFPQSFYIDIKNPKTDGEFNAKGPAYAASSQPSLNVNALPPIFSAQPFRSTSTSTTTFTPSNEQQLPTTNSAHFTENVGAHSEIKPDHIIPTQIPPSVTTQGSYNVEIIKSHQLTDFVSSIEYPATFVQAQSFDVQTQMPHNHKSEYEVPTNTVRYQNELVQPYTNSHVPASQLLTDPNNTASKHEGNTILSSETTYVPKQNAFNHQQQLPDFTTYAFNTEINQSTDNFPSASSHNNHKSLFHLQSNELYTTTEYPSETPHQTSSFIITERPSQSTSASPHEFVQSIRINEGHENFKQRESDRGTPKRLLDSPIRHLSNGLIGSPRPFTRDPVELDYRLGLLSRTQQSQQYISQPSTTEAPWTFPVTNPPKLSVSSAQPTPTSTYGAIDASGYFAGMSPPIPLPVVVKPNIQQIIVPYTTKSHPRPFEPARNLIASTTTTHHKGHRTHNIDLHEQQESMVVISTATEIPTTTHAPPTKYITKVLASNLRELLRREQALKNRSSIGVDLKKLQKNIDGWTEQEYTSLSHRPSTPTIRGHSKHIPAEYLTTTTTTPTPLSKILKASQIFDSTALSTSINNLQIYRAPERSKYLEYPPIEQNLVTDNESVVTQATTTSTTTPTTTTTRSSIYKTLDKYTTPIYMRPLPTQSLPEILWQKANILISPETKEKVYVVTPQPRFFPQRFVATTTTTPAPDRKNSVDQRKTARFLVRPTPGNGSINSTRNSTSAQYSPNQFGLSDLSTFVPVKPVEIIDGNSKVVTIVTPSAKPEQESDHAFTMSRSIRTDYVTIKRNYTKPTMSPSPR